MKTSFIYIGLSIMIALSSCQVGKRYINNAQDVKDIILQHDSTNHYHTLPWGKLYNDTTLTLLINQGLDQNLSIEEAVNRLESLEHLYRIEKKKLLPHLSSSIEGEYQETHLELDASLDFKWEADLWGKIKWGKKKAYWEVLKSTETLRLVQSSIIAQIAQHYFELNYLKRELTIVEQTLQSRKEAVNLAKLRYEGGLTSEITYRQAQVELARTSTLIPQLEKEIHFQESALSTLLGKRANLVYEKKNLQTVSIQIQLPADLNSNLILQRPDMIVAEYELKQAQADVGIAYASLFPQLQITSSIGDQSKDLKQFLKAPHWALAASLAAPIVEWGGRRAKLKAERSDYKAAVNKYQASCLDAFQEVSDAIIDVQKNIDIVVLRINLEEQARLYLDRANLQYINGVISYMEVLDAQREYFDAEIALNRALKNREVSIIKFYRSIGGGI